MGDGKLNVYNIGRLGVNVDMSDVYKEDGEFSKTQNGVPVDLGLGKRPGLVKHHASAGAGSILGGIGVPLALEANSINGTALGAGLTRTTYWGRRSKSATIGATQGWQTSTSGFTSAVTAILAGTPSNPRSDAIPDGWEALLFTAANGMPGSAVVVNNRLYYPSNSYTPNTNGAPIWVFDGTEDKKFTEIPKNAGAGYCAIMSMIAVGNTIYVSVYDDDNTATSARGRVFSLDASTGALIQLGAEFSAVAPYALCWHAGRLWVSTCDTSNAGKVYYFRPNIDTAWTLDRTLGSGTNCTVLISYKGELFAGGHGNPAPMDKRSSIGSWASSTTFGGAASEITAAVVFNGNLYVAYSPTVSGIGVIAKYNGSAWSTVYNPGSVGWYGSAWVDNGVMYFGGGAHNTSNVLVSTPDGAVFTDRSANLTTVATFCGLACVGTLLT